MTATVRKMVVRTKNSSGILSAVPYSSPTTVASSSIRTPSASRLDTLADVVELQRVEGAVPQYDSLNDTYVVKPLVWATDSFETRQDLVTAVSNGLSRDDGAVAFAGGLSYRWSSGSASISDLPDLVPHGEVNVSHFGAKADGVSDDAAAVTAALAYLPSTGGTLRFPNGTLLLSSTVTVSKPNVRLVGAGGDNRHQTSPFVLNAGTKLKWVGAVGGTVVRFTSVSGASNPKLNGGGMSGFVVDGSITAGRCMEVLSWNSGRFEEIMLFNATDTCLQIDVLSSLADARDPQENVFERIWVTSLSTGSDGIRLASATPGANPSYNTFIGLLVQVSSGTGVNLFNSDNNWFHHTRIFVTGGGNAVEFNGSDSDPVHVSRDNVFDHLTTDAPIVSRGTPSFTYAAGRNSCFNLDQTNGTPAPTIEVGTRMSYTFQDGVSYYKTSIKGIMATGEAQALAGHDFIANSAASAVIVNDSEAHLTFMNSSNTIRWVFRHDNSSGVMSLDQAAGSNGSFRVGRPFRPGYYTLAQLGSLSVANGHMTYVLDGLKTGETAGNGTGALMYYDGTAWRYPVPSSGGGTDNFLRADGTWAAAGVPAVLSGGFF